MKKKIPNVNLAQCVPRKKVPLPPEPERSEHTSSLGKHIFIQGHEQIRAKSNYTHE